jgi:hypothetical protein
VTVEMTPAQMRAAIDSRQDMDVLRDVEATPEQKANAAQKVAKKDPLSQDAQLSAGLLLLRLQLAGAKI